MVEEDKTDDKEDFGVEFREKDTTEDSKEPEFEYEFDEDKEKNFNAP